MGSVAAGLRNGNDALIRVAVLSRNVRLAVNYLRLLVEIACGGYRRPRTTGMEPM